MDKDATLDGKRVIYDLREGARPRASWHGDGKPISRPRATWIASMVDRTGQVTWRAWPSAMRKRRRTVFGDGRFMRALTASGQNRRALSWEIDPTRRGAERDPNAALNWGWKIGRATKKRAAVAGGSTC